MATTTLGIKLDVRTRERLKASAEILDRTPHWLMKYAVIQFIERVESGAKINDFVSADVLLEDTCRHSVLLRNCE
jgi:RHH-type proline utilization regulon transcriptional repressor/proline dehydrogenase/delta 1-pyrroline-5-carboxylate dehydrogenase